MTEAAIFEEFRAAYAARRDLGDAGSPWWHARLMGAKGYPEFAEELAGASFDAGLYRVHDDRTGPQALELIADAFPDFARRACPFGYDWLGRQLAVDADRVVDGQAQVLLLEPGTGVALEIPLSFEKFHDVELIEHPDAALASDFFQTWVGSKVDAVPLLRGQCVGYLVPPFLGGQDVVDNLESADLVVYWSICAQLRRQARQMPAGTSVNEVSSSRQPRRVMVSRARGINSFPSRL